MMNDGLGMMSPVMMLAMAIVVVIPAWRICAKAGYAGWFGLLAIVPIVNIVLFYVFAFAEWPIERCTSEPSR